MGRGKEEEEEKGGKRNTKKVRHGIRGGPLTRTMLLAPFLPPSTTPLTFQFLVSITCFTLVLFITLGAAAAAVTNLVFTKSLTPLRLISSLDGI